MIALSLLWACYPSSGWFEDQCDRTGGYWDGSSCLGDTAAPNVLDSNRAYAFVTERAVTGNIAELGAAGQTDPLEVADGICNDAAVARGLPGTYQAWLSTSTVDAVDRIQGDGPWYTLRNVELFPNKAAMRSVAQSAAWTTETKASVSTVDKVWTGTLLGGRAGLHCEDWTGLSAGGTTGEPSYRTEEWTDSGTSSCDDSYPLMCFSTL